MIQKKLSNDTLRRLQLALLGFFLLLLVAWICFSPFSGLVRYLGLNKQRAGITEKNKALEEQNQQLEKEIDALGKDPKHLEQTARDQFGLIKKNEIIYQFDSKK